MADTSFLITGGFFDAVDSDRLYSADQMNMPYKKLVHDGINREADGSSPGFAVTAGGGMNVLVAAGNAMIGGKWAENKAVQTIAVAGNTSGSARIDSIILQCDKSRAVRAVQIVYRQGTTAAPDLVSDNDITELRLANIRVPAAASAIASENITDTRGGAECPWVRSVFDAPDARYIVEEYAGTELAGAYQTVKSAVDSIRYAAQSGQPTVALQASEMIDSNRVYLYQGNETGYSAGYLYYYSDAAGAWIRGAQYGASVVDADLDEDSENPVQNKVIAAAIKTVRSFVVQVPGSAGVYTGSIATGDFVKALATYTAGSVVYAVKDGEVYQLSAADSSTMTFTQMYHGTMNIIKQLQITSEDTFTVTNTALSSSAADTSYNNTASGLSATNVQAAVDETNEKVAAVNGRLGDLKEDISEYESIFTGDVDESVKNWLDEHPEATTTVEDHSLTYNKLVNGTLGFVTPEMFGAKGDGETDDSEAIIAMFSVYSPEYVLNGDYICNSEIRLQRVNNIKISGIGTIYKESTEENSNLFDFLECKNIVVDGITVKSSNNQTPDSPGSHSVRTGALLSNINAFTIDNSDNLDFRNLKFEQIGYCFSIGTWNTTESIEDYRNNNIRLNNLYMRECGMGIYCRYVSDLSFSDWIFDDMNISPGGYHMFYGGINIRHISLTNLVFNGNEYSDDVILVLSTAEDSINANSDITIENITANCSHFASTEPNDFMLIKNANIQMRKHYSENMALGNSSVIITYYDSTRKPNVMFDNCIIDHVNGYEQPLIAKSNMNINLQFVNCDIKLPLLSYSINEIIFRNCKMSGRRLINASLDTQFATKIAFLDCNIICVGYSIIFNLLGTLVLDNCRFTTNHNRIVHSIAQVGNIYAYYNIVDSSYATCVFGLDSTYISNYRDLNNTIYVGV